MGQYIYEELRKVLAILIRGLWGNLAIVSSVYNVIDIQRLGVITRKILECVCPVLGGECGLKTGRGWLTHLAVSVLGVEQDKPRQEGTVQLLGKQEGRATWDITIGYWEGAASMWWREMGLIVSKVPGLQGDGSTEQHIEAASDGL